MASMSVFRYLLIALLLAGLASARVVAADRVYRWEDADGQVHYSGQRPAAGPYKLIEKSVRAPAGGVASAASDTKEFLERADAANKAAAEQKALQQKAQAESRMACEQARQRLDFLKERTPRRLGVENPDGTVARMDEVEFEKRRAAAQKLIQQHCRS